MQIRQIRFLGSDAAIVHLRGFVTKKGEATADKPDAVPVAIVQRAEDRWKIVAFQSTPFIVPELQESMQLGELRKILADFSDDEQSRAGAFRNSIEKNLHCERPLVAYFVEKLVAEGGILVAILSLRVS